MNKKYSLNSTLPVIDHYNVINISRPIELFLLFWIDEPDSGRKMFSEAAQTRLNNIKKESWYKEHLHKVHCPPIQTLQEIQVIINNYIQKYGGRKRVKTREIGIFSHSGTDGPITYDTPNYPPLDNDSTKQMHINGWASIDFNWAKHKGDTDSRCVFYGCRSATKNNSFAKRISSLSNYSGVEVVGQSESSFPSVFPDYRVTTGARSIPIMSGFGWDIANTYMVGSDRGKGMDSVTMQGTKNPKLSDFPKAKAMNFYRSGSVTKSSHQGIFNDHR